MVDYARILKDFNKYDKSDKSIAKTERFSHFINEQLLIYETLRDILENSNIPIRNARKMELSEHEIKSLNLSISYFIGIERRTAAANA